MNSFRSLLSKLPISITKARLIPPKVQVTEEPIEKYHSGGYYRVRLGDTFDEGRFSDTQTWLGSILDCLAGKGCLEIYQQYLCNVKDDRHVVLKILVHDLAQQLSALMKLVF
jgi:hypothetical protein